MKNCNHCHQATSEDMLTDGLCNQCESGKPEILRRLQSRVLELETELKRQKLSSESSGRVLQMLWGYRFNTESLH